MRTILDDDDGEASEASWADDVAKMSYVNPVLVLFLKRLLLQIEALLSE